MKNQLKKWNLIFAIVPAALLAVAPALAATSPTDGSVVDGLSAAYETTQQAANEMDSGVLAGIAQRGLDILVAQGIQSLRDAGDNQSADQFESEWKNQISLSIADTFAYAYSVRAGGFSALDLGDHDPLSPWLANFYQELSKKTAGLIKAIQILSDINTMNYALGVVLRPNGAWRTHSAYDRIEYRKHFIPFANILTYWISLEACKYYAPQYDQLCSYGADWLEKEMGRYVAPTISDDVFALLTGQNGDAVCSVRSLHVQLTEQEFVNQIMQQASK